MFKNNKFHFLFKLYSPYTFKDIILKLKRKLSFLGTSQNRFLNTI